METGLPLWTPKPSSVARDLIVGLIIVQLDPHAPVSLPAFPTAGSPSGGCLAELGGQDLIPESAHIPTFLWRECSRATEGQQITLGYSVLPHARRLRRIVTG